jgi:hypothetical protein
MVEQECDVRAPNASTHLTRSHGEQADDRDGRDTVSNESAQLADTYRHGHLLILSMVILRQMR